MDHGIAWPWTWWCAGVSLSLSWACVLRGCRSRSRGEALFFVDLSHLRSRSQQQKSRKVIGGDWTEKGSGRKLREKSATNERVHLLCACVVHLAVPAVHLVCLVIPADTRHLHHLGLFQACRVLPCPFSPRLYFALDPSNHPAIPINATQSTLKKKKFAFHHHRPG